MKTLERNITTVTKLSKKEVKRIVFDLVVFFLAFWCVILFGLLGWRIRVTKMPVEIKNNEWVAYHIDIVETGFTADQE